MKNKLYIQFAALFTTILCMGTYCNKENIEYKYHFAAKVNLYPLQKKYKPGDTIWIQYSNPEKKLLDKLSNQYIPADTVVVSFQVSFNCMYFTPVNPPEGFCDYVAANGVNVNRYLGVYGTGFLYETGCNSINNYDFVIAVVPKQKGIYTIALWGSPEIVRPCNNRISPFPFSSIEYTFNVADCNRDIYLSIPERYRPKGAIEGQIDGKQAYVVNVE